MSKVLQVGVPVNSSKCVFELLMKMPVERLLMDVKVQFIRDVIPIVLLYILEVLGEEGPTGNGCFPYGTYEGNCYDNAVAESFFGTLKKELVYFEDYKTRDEAKRSIFEYIDIVYNRKRRHSSLGYKSPVEFEKL